MIDKNIPISLLEADGLDIPASGSNGREPDRAQEAKIGTKHSTHDRKERATNNPVNPVRKQPRDKAQEVEQLYSLIYPLARLQGRAVFLAIPHENGNALPCRLSTVKRDGEQARVWVCSQYRERYGCSPLISTYNDACIKVHASLIVSSEPTTEEGRDEDTRKPRNEIEAQIKRVKESADWISQSLTIRVMNARVEKQGAERGLWRLDGRKTCHLTDALVQVLLIDRPSSTNRNARYSSFVLKFTNARGQTKRIEVTDEQIVSNELANKLNGFATYPEEEQERRHFLEAIKALACHEGTAVRENVETLGYQKGEDGKIIGFTQANGGETLTGFVLKEEAPFSAPTIPSTGNGYYGQVIPPEVSTPEIDFWRLLVIEYAPHPDIDVIHEALLGLAAVVQLPEGIAPEGLGIENGTLRISPDIIGPPRHGKSRTLNAHLSQFGTRFYWDTPPLLTFVGGGRGDTGPGRNGLISSMRYHLWVDFDHKAKPGTSDFPSQHKSRSDTIENYVDGPTGGSKSSRTGDMSGRGVPTGCGIRTSNHDHSITSIDEEKDTIEARACTFIWPEGIKGNDEVSHLLDEHRVQGYAMGQSYRRWCMQRVNTAPEDFKAEVDTLYTLARALTNGGRIWAYDYHRNHTVMMVLGVLLLQSFLEDTRPGYFLIQWAGDRIEALIENRLQRSSYIKSLVEQKKEQASIDTLALDTLRYHFSTSMLYIRSQKDELLTASDIEGLPFNLKDIGYHSVMRDGVEKWESGRQCIGYLVHKKQDIALDTGLLMEVLHREADKKHITLGSPQHVLSLLIEKGVVIPDVDKDTGKVRQSEQRANVAGKVARYAIIPIPTLFVAEVIESGKESENEEEDGNEENLYAGRPSYPCKHCGSQLKYPRAIDGKRIWICGKCKGVYEPSEKPTGREEDTPSTSEHYAYADAFNEDAIEEIL